MIDGHRDMDSIKRVNENTIGDHTAYWLHRLSVAVLSQFENALKDYGITVAQWKVMIVIFRGDASTPFAAAKFLDVDNGSVTRVVDRLLAKGLVARTPSLDDKRSVELSLTLEGSRLISQLLDIADQQDDQWLTTLSRAELLTFKSLLSRLLLAQGIETPEMWSRSGLCTDPR